MEASGARTRTESTTGAAGSGPATIPEAGTTAALRATLPALARQLGRVADALERLGPGAEPDSPTGCCDEAAGPLTQDEALELLRGEPDEVLARIRDGDPLRIGGICVAYVERHALLLQFDRLYSRAQLRVAVAAARYEGAPPPADWLAPRVHEAAYELLAEDRDGEAGQELDSSGWSLRYNILAAQLGIEPGETRRIAIVFNHLDEEVRRAFFRVVLRGQPVAEYAVAAGIAVMEAQRLVDRGRDAMGLPEGWRPPSRAHTAT